METGSYLVDVRTPAEYKAGHLPGAVNIDWLAPDFSGKWEGIEKDASIYVYCKLGGRSSSAATRLSELGFTKVVDLSGGWDAYSRKD